MISIVVFSPLKVAARFHSLCGNIYFFPFFVLRFGEVGEMSFAARV
jgi:hypothetical protein